MVWGGGLLDQLGATTGITNYTLRGKMFSLTGLILASLAKEKMSSREYRSARRRLMRNYTIEAIEKIQTRLMASKDLRSVKLADQKLIKQFRVDHQIYVRTFKSIIAEMVKAFQVANMKEEKIVHFYPELQAELEAYIRANPDHKVFPEKVTEAFKKRLDKVFRNLTETLHKELDLMIAESTGHTNFKMAYLFPGIGKLRKAYGESRGVREVKSLQKDSGLEKQLEQAISEQISSSGSGIQQNFLALLIHYAVLCERVFGSLKKIKSDALAIILFMDTDVVRVERKLSLFLLAFQNDPLIKGDITSIKEEFDNEYRKLKDYLVYEETKVKDLKEQVDALQSVDVPDQIAKILTMDEAELEAASDAIFHRRTQHLIHRAHLIPDHPLNR